MNVLEMMETIKQMDIPYDAKVVMVHAHMGDGDEREISMIAYDPSINVMYLCENLDW